MFTAALFTVAKTWKQPVCPSIEDWIKMRYIHTTEHCSARGKDEMLPSATTSADLGNTLLSAVSQKMSRTIWFPSYAGYKTESNKWTNKTNKPKLIDMDRWKGGWGLVKAGFKHMVMEGDLTLGGKHTMQYTDGVQQNCTLKTYIILLPNVTPIKLI